MDMKPPTLYAIRHLTHCYTGKDSSLYHKLLAILQDKTRRHVARIEFSQVTLLHRISSVRICSHHGTPMFDTKRLLACVWNAFQKY